MNQYDYSNWQTLIPSKKDIFLDKLYKNGGVAPPQMDPNNPSLKTQIQQWGMNQLGMPNTDTIPTVGLKNYLSNEASSYLKDAMTPRDANNNDINNEMSFNAVAPPSSSIPKPAQKSGGSGSFLRDTAMFILGGL